MERLRFAPGRMRLDPSVVAGKIFGKLRNYSVDTLLIWQIKNTLQATMYGVWIDASNLEDSPVLQWRRLECGGIFPVVIDSERFDR